MQGSQNASDGRTVGPDARPAEPAGRKLIDANAAAAKAGCSVRTWLRLCECGRAPWGVKLGALRRWNLDELDRWIAAGCPAVRAGKADSR